MENLAFQGRNSKWSLDLIVRDVKKFTVKLLYLAVSGLLVCKIWGLEYLAVIAAIPVGLVIFTSAVAVERLWVTPVRVDGETLFFDHPRAKPRNVHDVELSRVEEVDGGFAVHIRYKVRRGKYWGYQVHLDPSSQVWEVLSKKVGPIL